MYTGCGEEEEEDGRNSLGKEGYARVNVFGRRKRKKVNTGLWKGFLYALCPHMQTGHVFGR